ncbi:SDR family oxidoreductase [Phenylobacterium sp.]|uniref:SDR family oxidoreductase n=1 Tax=Phenylobacterium sp. TaxID=1871053 RepID=UPI002E3175FD|nr:SDR family oxidoreductase [Phenylobacterium sp.]HEX4710105.1 SDR family oxidoreductase [Phenylobacterium sp.]
MAVLVLGGYGLIGSAVIERLRGDGIPVIGLGRDVRRARRQAPDVEWREADLALLQRAEDWPPLLLGVDAVVNAAGVLQQGLTDKVSAVQDRAMRALFAAAKASGVRRIVQISAVGAEGQASTEFLRSKACADAALCESGLEFVILRPGLVISPVAYGGTALLRGLAAFPGVTPLVFPKSSIQTVWIGDVVEAVASALRPSTPSGVIDLVEETPRSLAETVALFRQWQGRAPVRQLQLPNLVGQVASACADALGWLGWRSPVRSTALAVMRHGVVGNAADGPARLGRKLRSLPESLAALSAGPQERWFAGLWLAKPLIIGSLSAFWIASGLIGALRFGGAASILTDRGASAGFANAAVLAGDLIDIGLGLSVIVRPLAGWALKGMILTSLAYLAGATVLAPDLWLDPLGSMVKVVPAIVLALVGLAVLGAR